MPAQQTSRQVRLLLDGNAPPPEDPPNEPIAQRTRAKLRQRADEAGAQMGYEDAILSEHRQPTAYASKHTPKHTYATSHKIKLSAMASDLRGQARSTLKKNVTKSHSELLGVQSILSTQQPAAVMMMLSRMSRRPKVSGLRLHLTLPVES